MKSKTQTTETRWLSQLEKPESHFWEALSTLGSTRLALETKCFHYQGPCELSSSFLHADHELISLQPSFNLKTSQIEKAYITDEIKPGSTALEFDFHHREAHLSLKALTPSQAQLLDNLAAIFGWQMMPETSALTAKRKLKDISLCPCCQKNIAERLRHPERHPLTHILQERVTKNRPLVAKLQAKGIQILTEITPKSLSFENSSLVISDNEQHELHLYNSHGESQLSLSAEQEEVARIWNTILTNAAQ